MLRAADQERIVGRAQLSAAVAVDAPSAVGERAAGQRDERRQFALRAAVPGQDRAEIGLHRLRLFLKAGQGDGAGVGMAGGGRDVRADQREAVAPPGDPRQQLREMHARRPRGNDAERPAILGRRVGLGIERVEMARRAPQEDEDHRLGPRRPAQRSPPPAPRRAKPIPAPAAQKPPGAGTTAG